MSVFLNNMTGEGSELDCAVAGHPNLFLVDTVTALSEVLNCLEGLPTEPPSIYIDLEGVKLSRQGTISILQLHILPGTRTYLIDVCLLQDKCFSTPGASGNTLKDILESSSIPKIFFDVRNDSDALYSHFKINLACIIDLQLRELATRNFSRAYIKGLSKCIERDAPLSTQERGAWMRTKDKGQRLFAPVRGGSCQVFQDRRLRTDILLYCAQDVQILPRLWTHYNGEITPAWKKVLEASMERVALSQSPSYNSEGGDRALAAGLHCILNLIKG